MARPTLFTKPRCAICGRAKQAMERARIKFREVSVHTADGQARHAMDLCGGSDATKLPMLKVDEECVYAVQKWAREHAAAG